MASRADDVVAKVTETLENPLYVAIGAVCSTPNQTTKKCRELGITTEGEKLAKWIAILKRDSQNLFGMSFLRKLKEIHDIKEDEEMKKLEIVEKISNEALCKKYKTLWKRNFVDVWFKRFKERTKNFSSGGEKLSILNNPPRVGFNVEEENHNVMCYFNICFTKPRVSHLTTPHVFRILIQLYPAKRNKDSYRKLHVPRISIEVIDRRTIRHARILAKWLQSHPDWCDEIEIIKEFT